MEKLRRKIVVPCFCLTEECVADALGAVERSIGLRGDLLAQALASENMQRAWKRVKANKGAAGVDGLDILQTHEHRKHAWTTIRQQLMNGMYRPMPVRRVGIPKPDGSERELGITTLTDRLIQQALLQVLQPLLDPTFSEHSHGSGPAVVRAMPCLQHSNTCRTATASLSMWTCRRSSTGSTTVS